MMLPEKSVTKQFINFTAHAPGVPVTTLKPEITLNGNCKAPATIMTIK